MESMTEDKRPIKMKFTFSWMSYPEGHIIVKGKVRLVGIGCARQKGIEYCTSTSPSSRARSRGIRTVVQGESVSFPIVDC